MNISTFSGFLHFDRTFSSSDCLLAVKINEAPTSENEYDKYSPIPELAPVIHTVF